MKKIETAKKFISLTISGEDKVLYIRPKDIVALSWNAKEGVTKLTTINGEDYFQDIVEETHGVIFDKCDKALQQYDK